MPSNQLIIISRCLNIQTSLRSCHQSAYNIMTEIIRQYINRHYEGKPDLNTDARKMQFLNEYLDTDKAALFRKGDEPIGLRRVGTGLVNSFVQLLAYMNDFVDELADFHPKENQLLVGLQDTLARILYSKYSFTDATELHALVRQATSEFLSFPGLFDLFVKKMCPKELLGLFQGTTNQYEDDLEVIRKSQETFTSLSLNTKHRTLQTALEAYKNRISQQGSTALQFCNTPPLLVISLQRTMKDAFVFPTTLTLNLANQAQSDKLQQQVDQLDQKISKVEKLLQRKEFQGYQQALTNTLKFLEAQEFMNLEDAGLGLEELSCHFGVYGSEDQHEDTKQRVKYYLARLEKHEEELKKTAQALVKEKAELIRKENSDRYTLFGVLIEAREDLHYCYIYNDKQRKWKKFHDKKVTEVSEVEVKKASYDSAVALFYKIGGMVCNPSCRNEVLKPFKEKAVLADYNLSKRIQEGRIERILKNYSDLAKEEIEYYAQTYKQNDMAFLEFFSSPLYYFLSQNNTRMAQLVSLNNYLRDPSFLQQLSLLTNNQPIKIPQFPLTFSREYTQLQTIIKTALLLQSNGKILPALQLLAQCLNTQTKNPFLKSCCDKFLILFLLKACFYLDLKVHQKADQATLNKLVENIMYINGLVPACPQKTQVVSNVKNTLGCLGMKLADRYNANITECNQLEQPQRKLIDELPVGKLLAKRFKLWIDLMTEIRKTKRSIPQEERIGREMIKFVEEV